MSINLACRCGKQMRVGEELAGRKARCPNCGRRARIPSIAGQSREADDASPQPWRGRWLFIILLTALLAVGMIASALVYRAVTSEGRPREAALGTPDSVPAVSPLAAPPLPSGDTAGSPEASPSVPAPGEPLPMVEFSRTEPADPEAGKPLVIQLACKGEGLDFEYRADGVDEWLPARDGKVVLPPLQPGPLTIEARARDKRERISPVAQRTWLIRAAMPATFAGITDGPRPDMPEPGRVDAQVPDRPPMKPFVLDGQRPADPMQPRVQQVDPRRDPQLLVWKLKPADRLYQEVLVSQKSVYRIQGIDVGTNVQYAVLSRFEVGKPKDDGLTEVTHTVEAARLIQADQLTESLLAGAIQKMPGTVYKLTLNRKMEIVRFEGQDSPLRVLGDPFGGGAFAMASLIDRDGWRELDQLTFFQPERAIVLNEHWQKPMTHAWGALGSWNGQVAYRYLGKQGQYHRVVYGMNLVHVPNRQPSGGLPFQLTAASFKHQEAGGMIWFDTEKGRVVGADERFNVRGQIGVAAGGQDAPIDVAEDQAFRVIVHDRNPWQN